MKFIIIPMNEGQEMNCRQKFSGNKTEARATASRIARVLQAALPDCSITCGLQTESESLRGYDPEILQ